jgi:CheY-like chemotaxis protein
MTTSLQPIGVLLADDENLVRSAMRALLALEDDIDVIAEAASGAEALAMARARRPDVAVLDLQMPDMDGISVAETLHAEFESCRTMIVTSHGRPGYLKRALSAGVRGFVPKTVSGSVLADVVRTRIFVTDIARWVEYGRAHGEAFGTIRPATSMVQVGGLIDPEMLVEIEAVAYRPGIGAVTEGGELGG